MKASLTKNKHLIRMQFWVLFTQTDENSGLYVE
jgi:hypothetical protein